MIERSWVRIPAGAVGEFSSPGSTLCADSYFGICSTPVLPQKHVKDPGHSAKSAGGRLCLNTHTPYVYMWLCMKQRGAWLYGVHRTCAEMAAVSCGTSHASFISTPLRWIFKNTL